MSLKIPKEDSSGGGDFVPVPVGTHPARCIALYDTGHQLNQTYNKWQHKIFVTWEVPGHTYDGEDGAKLMTISKRYTLSLNEKASLYHDLKSWLNPTDAEWDQIHDNLKMIVGIDCLITVTHSQDKQDASKTWANVTAVTGVPDGTSFAEVPESQRQPHTVYDMSDDPDRSKVDDLPEWIQRQIKKSREWGPAGDVDGHMVADDQVRNYQLHKTHQPTGDATPEAVEMVKDGTGVDTDDDIPFAPNKF